MLPFGVDTFAVNSVRQGFDDIVDAVCIFIDNKAETTTLSGGGVDLDLAVFDRAKLFEVLL